jgi:bifunctional non-homologous end joining protein LigD
MASLDSYRAKRNPAKTPEPVPPAKKAGKQTRPAGRRGRGKRSQGPSFVIQEHHARSLHWDFRLERDGVLVSWAIPKGLPQDRGVNHLAVHVEDHPLEYGAFEGTIPSGEYGAGKVTIWDHGQYECEKWTDREVKVTLHGDRVDGGYALFRTGGKNWMIHKMDPAPEDWRPLPDLVRPMLAVRGTLPRTDEGWSYEFKWDGVRAVAYCEGGRARLLSRNDRDVTASYPELRALGDALGSMQCVLDGEIVVVDDRGRPSFSALQQRMHVADAARARRLSARFPVVYMLFDVLHLDGHPTVELPYRDRRSLLESLALSGSHLATPPSFDEPGAVVLEAARGAGLEGVVAKRSASPYQPGRRSSDWVKVKIASTQEVVVGGWSSGRGSRSGAIGSLLLGIPTEKGLAYVGRVGTGFTEEVLADLARRLKPLARRTSPYATEVPSVPGSTITWVRPKLVGEVEFGEWTREGRLRHPIWRGLRPDKEPEDVTRES